MFAVLPKRSGAGAPSFGGPNVTTASGGESPGGTPAVEAWVQGHFGTPGADRMPAGGEAERLVGLYLANGRKAVERVDGSFSFAVVDHRDGTAHVGVDKLGQAQGFFAETEDAFVFTTTLAEMLAQLPSRPTLDMASVYDYLSLGWVPSPRSLFNEVSKVEPGSFVIFDGTRSEMVGYYAPYHTSCFVSRSDTELAYETREHLHAAVERGVGWADSWSSFLSGGLDSSSVVYALSSAASKPLSTYYGNFGALDRFMALPDEARVAQAVADRFGTDHSVVTIPPDVITRVPELVRIIEEPLVDGGPVVVDAVMRAASEVAGGIMTGVGGDFLFGGERRHLLVSLLRQTRNLPGWGVAARLAEAPTGTSEFLTRVRFDLQRTIGMRTLPLGEFYARRLHTEDLVEAVCRPEIFKGIERSPMDPIDACLASVPELDDLTKLLYLDLRLLTPDCLTRDVHALGLSHGLAVCNPYLDADFVDFSMTVPPQQKVRGLTLKYGMRKAITGYLPPEVLKKKKGGLGAPIRWWVTHDDSVAEHLSREVVEGRGLFDHAEIARMRDDTLAERRDYSVLLWSLYTLESWMRQFVD